MCKCESEFRTRRGSGLPGGEAIAGFSWKTSKHFKERRIREDCHHAVGVQTHYVPNYEDQKRVMNLSLAVAAVLLGAKVTAAVITGSSAVYSDAAESVVHLLAALNIMRVGFKLIRDSLRGLLDEADPKVEQEICELLDQETAKRGLSYHNFRHRHSGRTHWVEFHLVFADSLSVDQAHEAATEIEASVADLLKPDGRVISHLEPRSAEHHAERWEAR